jgi:hypothetical protein
MQGRSRYIELYIWSNKSQTKQDWLSILKLFSNLVTATYPSCHSHPQPQ